MCWLTWGIWIICGFPPPHSCGPPRADTVGTGFFYKEGAAALWGVLLLPAPSLPSVHSAVLEMELLPLWLCLGFHFLTVEWRHRGGMVTAASQGGCELVSFPGYWVFLSCLLFLCWGWVQFESWWIVSQGGQGMNESESLSTFLPRHVQVSL